MPREPRVVDPKHAHLVEEWKVAHAAMADHYFSDDCDFENFCWGWCVAKGLTVDEAHFFYDAMIELRVF